MSEKNLSVKLDKPTGGSGKLSGRDTIYIDTEDDITSVIEKVKTSSSSVITLVPPKRVGILQSVVNLKLLQKAAKTDRKKIAIVTADASLMALAAGLRIPVARTLNSQPEFLEVPDMDNEDDVINGDEIAIGELARMGEKKNVLPTREDKDISAAVAAIETDDKIKNDRDADGEPDDKPKKPTKSKGHKVPNFNKFRKRLFIFGGLAVVVIAFLVWAIGFAPHGVITVSAKTNGKDIEAAVSLQPSSATDINNSVIQPVVKQIKKTETMNFKATGKKMVGGEKATGKVVLTNHRQGSAYNCNENTGECVPNVITLQKGTMVISGDLQFSLDSSVTIGASESATLSVTATSFGEKYNISADAPVAISGYDQTVLDGAASGDFSGGKDQTPQTIVQQSDIDTATDQLRKKAADEQDSAKADLTDQMGGDVTVLQDSFSTDYGDVNSKPKLSEALKNGDAAATMEITYTLIAIPDSDLKSWLNKQIDVGSDNRQKIFDDGLSKIQFKNFAKDGNNYTVVIKTTAQIGPQINEQQIKEQAVGKRSGQIVADIESIPGVSSATVNFSPFWVSTAPAADRLKVEFTVEE